MKYKNYSLHPEHLTQHIDNIIIGRLTKITYRETGMNEFITYKVSRCLLHFNSCCSFFFFTTAVSSFKKNNFGGGGQLLYRKTKMSVSSLRV
jgi:hypothetical protein